MRLEGRVALVTGGGTGLGRAIACELARREVHVAVNYNRSEAAAEAVAEAIRARGGTAVAVQADVADRAAVLRMIDTVERAIGPVEVLANNAGTTRYVPFADLGELSEELWDQIMSVNLLGPFFCAQAVAPTMLRRGAGKILNIASNSAFTAAGSSIPYVVSKSALVSLTRCLARALAPVVQVNAIAPGWMMTDWIERNFPAQEADSLRRGETPVVAVEDVAQIAVDVLANESLTGEIVVADRGQTLM